MNVPISASQTLAAQAMPTSKAKMKVALVHDYLNQYGGAERVLEELHDIWPEAPVFVAIYHPDSMPPRFATWDIRPSWINSVPFANRKHRAMLPLYPHVFESFDLSDYDLIISSSSGFAHGVLTGPQTLHVCYCHSPPRFLWENHAYVNRERLSGLKRALISSQMAWLRTWDRNSAERADAWISTSQLVRARIRKYYGKESAIIPPPIDISHFEVAQGPGQYFLMLMRLVGWKRPEIVVEACSKLNLPLVVAGDGRDLGRLRAIAGDSVNFVGRVDDVGMRNLYRDCRALIVPSEEDFGITPLEAMASGRPVIAFGRGGVLDTTIQGVTGEFFFEQTASSLASLLQSFDDSKFDPASIRAHAVAFDRVNFRDQVYGFVQNLLGRIAEGEWIHSKPFQG